MNITTFSDTRKEALSKWREYRTAEKMSGDPIYKELKQVYNQIKTGRKVIDIFKAIKEGGVHQNYRPKLAIAKANNKQVRCRYDQNGDIIYCNKSRTGWPLAEDVILKDCLPKIPKEFLPKASWNTSGHDTKFELQAPVPIIPPKHLPKVLTDDYYILWEVDQWKMIPPTDPWLLRRITKTMFVVLAGWDLTELEKSVMAGRIR